MDFILRSQIHGGRYGAPLFRAGCLIPTAPLLRAGFHLWHPPTFNNPKKPKSTLRLCATMAQAHTKEIFMQVILITYDLNKPGQDYQDFHSFIKKHNWARLSESSYAITSAETVSAIMESLRRFMDQNDNVYIITLKRPYSGFGPKAVNDWLEQFLTY
jgi:hypothetical protein